MTILLTGGTGFIGRHLSARSHDADKTAMVRLVRSTLHPDFDERTDLAGDLANAADVDQFVRAGSTLVHLACNGNPRSSNRDIIADLEQNLLPTVRLFERFAIRQPRGHVIFASTGGDMYSFDPPHHPRREENPPTPQSSHSIHKLAAERYLGQFCRLYGIAGTILRIGNSYGDPVPEKTTHGLIGVALRTLFTGRQMAVIDPLSSVRDYIHLDDLCDVFRAMIANPPSSGVCRVLNVGSGIGHSIAEVFKLIERVTGRAVNWRDEIPPGRPSSWNVLDTTRLRSLTGWRARIDLEQGIAMLWRRYEQLYASRQEPTTSAS
ncbi:MAG TPA: NAD-dependent epimerase/dehydratase family protein [Xanthobacteraceae bacterium]|nr:NAD-dependent epimerase/dehydratase family protein [Xanthobacteraceae bacterium]